MSSQSFEISDYIRAIGVLPDLVLKRDGILPDSLDEGDQGFVLKKSRELYKTVMQWLQYYLLDRADLLPELTFTRKVNYKPHAEISLANLRLAQEIFPRVGWIQEGVESPAMWWWWIECECFRGGSNLCGLTGKPSLQGEREWANSMFEHLEQRSNVQKMFVSLDEILADPDLKVIGIKKERTELTPFRALDRCAIEIANQDFSFRNGPYHQYLRVKKRCLRTIRNNPLLKLTYLLEDGSLFTTEKHKKIPKQPKKGFVKKH